MEDVLIHIHTHTHTHRHTASSTLIQNANIQSMHVHRCSFSSLFQYARGCKTTHTHTYCVYVYIQIVHTVYEEIEEQL